MTKQSVSDLTEMEMHAGTKLLNTLVQRLHTHYSFYVKTMEFKHWNNWWKI